MGYTLREIADHLQGKLEGPEERIIDGVAPLDQAQPNQLSFLADNKYLSHLSSCRAGAILASEEAQIPPNFAVIRTPHPYYSFAKAVEFIFKPYQKPQPTISPQASLAQNVHIGENVYIAPFVHIEEDVQIGDGTVIYPFTYIGKETTIGMNCTIYSRVSIYPRTQIGHRVILHAGVVLGSDGFGYTLHQGAHYKIPQVGRVVIEDDVEIGANSTIDRATMGETRIGKGTKVDNLVQIAHNVRIGQGGIIVSQCGISGSCSLGNYVTLAGQVGIADHITVGDQAIVAAKSGLSKNVPEKSVMFGYPAKPISEMKRILALINRLPDMKKKIQQLESKVQKLTALLEKEEG